VDAVVSAWQFDAGPSLRFGNGAVISGSGA